MGLNGTSYREVTFLSVQKEFSNHQSFQSRKRELPFIEGVLTEITPQRCVPQGTPWNISPLDHKLKVLWPYNFAKNYITHHFLGFQIALNILRVLVSPAATKPGSFC